MVLEECLLEGDMPYEDAHDPHVSKQGLHGLETSQPPHSECCASAASRQNGQTTNVSAIHITTPRMDLSYPGEISTVCVSVYQEPFLHQCGKLYVPARMSTRISALVTCIHI